ncbi:MAG: hypothetical protein KF718_28950 [Polyangiaceae bacterium]|nr:hypothetical protein [Polyangiaceae bacterium]
MDLRLACAVSGRTMLVVVGLLLPACDGCSCGGGKPSPPAERSSRAQLGCSSDDECGESGPCSVATCAQGRCSTALAPKGTSCDDGDACNGIALCDGLGGCVPGAPPNLDDGDPCTVDSCDPVHGPRHQPVAIDDFDVCTIDRCDPVTGQITHEPVDLDDGDDCTFDTCDPKSGVSHRRLPTTTTCGASCGAGYHPTSRSPSSSCGPGGMQTLCAPDCGTSFYSCADTCPGGYHVSTRSPSAQCGADARIVTFCMKNAGEPFYTCDPACPSGYGKQGESATSHCGPDVRLRTRCVPRPG